MDTLVAGLRNALRLLRKTPGLSAFGCRSMPLVRGRVFDERGTGKATPVALLNDAMAKKYWPKEDPIGARITIARGLGPEFEDPTRVARRPLPIGVGQTNGSSCSSRAPPALRGRESWTRSSLESARAMRTPLS
jgi:hypothetical protein